jgi:hypothetical protein
MPPKTPYDHMSAQLPAMRLIAKAVGLIHPQVRESWRQVESQLAVVQEIKMNIALFSERYVPLGWANYDRMSSKCAGQVFSDTAIGCLIANCCSKALGGKLPSLECRRTLL